MTAAYFQTLFGDAARALQEEAGSRAAYARMEQRQGDGDLTGREAAFLAARDSFYLATVTEDGWPYVQHRGGSTGFVRVLGPRRIAFPDYAGNRQYISVGNIAGDDRVALFFMDYPARRRLKLIGHASVANPDPSASGGDAGEHMMIVDVVGLDWNCPQWITPRYTAAEMDELRDENERLRTELAALRGDAS